MDWNGILGIVIAPGIITLTSMLRSMRGAFPDFHLTIEDQIAEGNKVITRVTFRGTHRGDYRGIAPTGKQIKYSGIAIDRIVDGKVARG
jgi:predicted ester cyclase